MRLVVYGRGCCRLFKRLNSQHNRLRIPLNSTESVLVTGENRVVYMQRSHFIKMSIELHWDAFSLQPSSIPNNYYPKMRAIFYFHFQFFVCSFQMVMIVDAIVYFIVHIIFFLSSFFSKHIRLLYKLLLFVCVCIRFCCVWWLEYLFFRWFHKMSRLFYWNCRIERNGNNNKTTTLLNMLTAHSSVKWSNIVINVVLDLGPLYLQWFAAFEQQIDLFIN